MSAWDIFPRWEYRMVGGMRKSARRVQMMPRTMNVVMYALKEFTRRDYK